MIELEKRYGEAPASKTRKAPAEKKKGREAEAREAMGAARVIEPGGQMKRQTLGENLLCAGVIGFMSYLVADLLCAGRIITFVVGIYFGAILAVVVWALSRQ
jgi:hypothetical protein